MSIAINILYGCLVENKKNAYFVTDGIEIGL